MNDLIILWVHKNNAKKKVKKLNTISFFNHTNTKERKCSQKNRLTDTSDKHIGQFLKARKKKSTPKTNLTNKKHCGKEIFSLFVFSSALHFLHRALSEKKGKKHYFKCNLDYYSYIIIILVHWGTHAIQEKKTVLFILSFHIAPGQKNPLLTCQHSLQNQNLQVHHYKSHNENSLGASLLAWPL